MRVDTTTRGTSFTFTKMKVNNQTTTVRILLGVVLTSISRHYLIMRHNLRQYAIKPGECVLFFGPSGRAHRGIVWIEGVPHVAFPPYDPDDPYWYHLQLAQGYLRRIIDVEQRKAIGEHVQMVNQKRQGWLNLARRHVAFAMRRKDVWG